MYGATIGSLEVLVSSDNQTWTSLLTITGQQQTSMTDDWIPVAIDLTSYAGGMVYIKFVGTRGSSFTGDIAIDLVKVEGCVACPAPMNLTASNITATTADISWNAVTSATSYDLMWEATNTMNTTNTMETITHSTAPSASFNVMIQAICGTDTSAQVSTPVAVPLSNDSVCGAYMLTLGQTYYLNNTNATATPEDAGIAPPGGDCSTDSTWCNSNVDFTTWFTFVAPSSGNVVVTGEDVGYDGQVALYAVGDCGDTSTYTLLGANDDTPLGGVSPYLEICGLTPGDTIYLMHDSYSSFSGGNYSIRVYEPEAGSASNPLTKICAGDSLELSTLLTGATDGGTWSSNIPFNVINNDWFYSQGLAYQTYTFKYEIGNFCAKDSALADVEVVGPSSAGDDGTITACMNEPINLTSGLQGNVDLGGTWYDPQNNVTTADITTGTIPGQFNYIYIASNGTCPADTSNLVLTVDGNCDWLDIEELVFGAVEVYPNPTNGIVYISNATEEKFSYVITDISGRVLDLGNIEGATEKTLTINRENGIYFIKLTNDKAEKTYKVVKQ